MVSFHSEFKNSFSFEDRRNECSRMMEKFQDRIPVIIERIEASDLPKMDRKKLLVPNDIALGQLVQIIRKRITLQPNVSIFTYIGEQQKLVSISQPISQVYAENKDEDGFLYVFYTSESTYG